VNNASNVFNTTGITVPSSGATIFDFKNLSDLYKKSDATTKQYENLKVSDSKVTDAESDTFGVTITVSDKTSGDTKAVLMDNGDFYLPEAITTGAIAYELVYNSTPTKIDTTYADSKLSLTNNTSDKDKVDGTAVLFVYSALDTTTKTNITYTVTEYPVEKAKVTATITGGVVNVSSNIDMTGLEYVATITKDGDSAKVSTVATFDGKTENTEFNLYELVIPSKLEATETSYEMAIKITAQSTDVTPVIYATAEDLTSTLTVNGTATSSSNSLSVSGTQATLSSLTGEKTYVLEIKDNKTSTNVWAYSFATGSGETSKTITINALTANQAYTWTLLTVTTASTASAAETASYTLTLGPQNTSATLVTA
jgi:hypothetical protein